MRCIKTKYSVVKNKSNRNKKKRTFLIQFVPAQLQALKQGFVLVGQFMFLRHQEAN